MFNTIYLTKKSETTSLTQYDPSLPSEMLPSRIQFCGSIIVRWGLLPKNSFTPCGKKKLDWGSRFSRKAISILEVDVIFNFFGQIQHYFGNSRLVALRLVLTQINK